MWGDFNRDIVLIGRQMTTSIHHHKKKIYNGGPLINAFLNLEYIPTNTTFSRQSGNYYTSTNLIDGFYINLLDNSRYSSTTNTHIVLNSYHCPLILDIPHNTLLARPILPNNITQLGS